jgi:hypothetical protein
MEQQSRIRWHNYGWLGLVSAMGNCQKCQAFTSPLGPSHAQNNAQFRQNKLGVIIATYLSYLRHAYNSLSYPITSCRLYVFSFDMMSLACQNGEG